MKLVPCAPVYVADLRLRSVRDYAYHEDGSIETHLDSKLLI